MDDVGADRAAASQNRRALVVRGVAHRFGTRQALKDVSLEVGHGRFVALLGPNGAGKTTLFSIVTRLYHCRDGSVHVFGQDLKRYASAALAEIGVVFQARTLDQDLSVRQNLLYHAALHGMSRRAATVRTETLLARVGLGARIDDKVRTLSGGQSRRVEIARALVHCPRLLLLDEPTSGLDLASRSDILAIVRGLVRDDALSVLWATHLFDEIDPQDEVYVLHLGRIVARGTAGDITSAANQKELQTAFRALTSDDLAGEAA